MKVQTNFYFYISDFDTYEDYYYPQEYKAKSNFSKEFFEGKDLKLYFFKGTAESKDHEGSQDHEGAEFFKPDYGFPCVLYKIGGEDEPAIPDYESTKWKIDSNIGYTFETPDFDEVSVVFKDGKPDDFFAGDIDDYKRTLKRLMDITIIKNSFIKLDLSPIRKLIVIKINRIDKKYKDLVFL